MTAYSPSYSYGLSSTNDVIPVYIKVNHNQLMMDVTSWYMYLLFRSDLTKDQKDILTWGAAKKICFPSYIMVQIVNTEMPFKFYERVDLRSCTYIMERSLNVSVPAPLQHTYMTFTWDDEE